MYCKNCGKEIAGNSKFCPFCGTSTENFSKENPSFQLFQGEALKYEGLKKYIKDSLSGGVSRENIEFALKNSGWPQDQIENAFSETLQKPQQAISLQDGTPVQPISQQAQPVASQFVYAGFWIRLVSYIIDGIILAAVWWIIETFIGEILASSISSLEHPTQGEVLGLSLVLIIFNISFYWLYFALFESSKKQGTVGKMILGLKVTDLSYQKISFGRATGRYFSKILSNLIFGIGFLMIAWDEEKQGLHDKLAKTYVIKAIED